MQEQNNATYVLKSCVHSVLRTYLPCNEQKQWGLNTRNETTLYMYHQYLHLGNSQQLVPNAEYRPPGSLQLGYHLHRPEPVK